MRKAFMYVLAVGALVLNPFFACGSRGSFTYGLAEIEAALAGTWDATITRDGQTQQVKFRIEPGDGKQQHSARGLVTPAAACANRTLVKSAHACMDSTDVPLLLIALDGSALKMSGSLSVHGTDFDRAFASLDIGGVGLSATLSPTGIVQSVEAGDNATAKLVHTK